MKVSAELRWFWREDEHPRLTAAAAAWFQGADAWSGTAPGGRNTAERLDVYIPPDPPSSSELGVKLRGDPFAAPGAVDDGLEFKGLVGYGTRHADGPFIGSVEIWGKWRAPKALALPHRTPLIGVAKYRNVRKLAFDGQTLEEVPLGSAEQPLAGRSPPSVGCQVELTRVVLPRRPGGGPWWTVGFEAFGPLALVNHVLDRTLRYARGGAPAFGEAAALSYPAWLAGRVAERPA